MVSSARQACRSGVMGSSQPEKEQTKVWKRTKVKEDKFVAVRHSIMAFSSYLGFRTGFSGPMISLYITLG